MTIFFLVIPAERSTTAELVKPGSRSKTARKSKVTGFRLALE
jgi:hypothetical protein